MQDVLIDFVSTLIVNNVYPLGEGATFDVLPRQSNVITLLQQAKEGQTFSHRPVDLSRLHEFRSSVHRPQHLLNPNKSIEIHSIFARAKNFMKNSYVLFRKFTENS